MLKIKLLLPAAIILGLGIVTLSASKKLQNWPQPKTQVREFSEIKSEPFGLTVEVDSLATRITTLEMEIRQLEKELASIDVGTEVNNPKTTQDRREWIIGRMNLYAKKMGQLAKMQVEQMNDDLKKDIQ